MNIYLLLLWFVACTFLGFFVFFTNKTTTAVINSKNISIQKPTGICSFNSTALPKPSGKICKGTGYNLMNIDGISYQAGTQSVYYTTVCASLCSQGVGSDGKCINDDKGTENKLHDKCISLLQPSVDCRTSANPIARLGNELYFARSAVTDGCITDS